MTPILQGSLRHFTAADLLTLLAARMQTGTIDFESGEKRARVVLRSGRVVGTDGADAVSTVGAVCYWADGNFSLLENVVTEGIAPADHEVGVLLEEVARHEADLQQYDNATTYRVIDDAGAQERLGLNPDELKILIRIGLGRSFAELAADRNRGEIAKTLRRLETGGVIARIVTSKPRPERKLTAGRQIVASLTADGAGGEAYPLLDDQVVIGRAATNAISITDGSVSTRHAQITRTADGFFIEDLGSRNGTFVNGEQVTEKRTLNDNDTVRLGKVIFTFNLAAEVSPGDTTAGAR